MTPDDDSPSVDSNENADRDATLELVIAIARSYHAIESGVRPHLADRGLGMSEFAVLEVLLHKGPLPVGAIRDRILVTGASTTYVVKKLEARGLVRRSPSAEDQRVVIAELTPTGKSLISNVFPDHVSRLREVMAGLSSTDKRAASQLLRQLSGHPGRVTPRVLSEVRHSPRSPS
jgi:MarR family transcriptional regulator, 2-MHQ and catechol-resistance regulon repressor